MIPTEGECWVHCGECGHAWVAAYMPMELEKFARVLLRGICPKCANSKLFMGKMEKKHAADPS